MAISAIPEGYLKNQSGHLVPKELVSEIDLVRDDLVLEIVEKAQDLRAKMVSFKQEVFDDIAAFIELSGEKYNLHIGGNKGNVTLLSFDGRYKIQRTIAEHMVFDERLQVAKELIDQCIHSWSEGSSANIRALIEHAFQVDKQGKISTARVLGLRRLDINDGAWVNAMDAISDSMQITGTKAYVRIYKRVGENAWQPIALDLAAL
jgi:hypothetical protein